VLDAANRQVRVDFSNQYIRYLAAYVRFFDADGNAISVPNWKPDGAGIVDDIVSALDIQYDDLRFPRLYRAKEQRAGHPIPPTAGSAPH
jgi:hypothetical protein